MRKEINPKRKMRKYENGDRERAKYNDKKKCSERERERDCEGMRAKNEKEKRNKAKQKVRKL